LEQLLSLRVSVRQGIGAGGPPTPVDAPIFIEELAFPSRFAIRAEFTIDQPTGSLDGEEPLGIFGVRWQRR
jgi:hypothetical protein